MNDRRGFQGFRGFKAFGGHDSVHLEANVVIKDRRGFQGFRGFEALGAQSIISWVFQEHTVTRASTPKA